MKNPADENAGSHPFIEENVFAHFEATQTRREWIARTPKTRILSNQIKGIQELTEVLFSLLLAP